MVHLVELVLPRSTRSLLLLLAGLCDVVRAWAGGLIGAGAGAAGLKVGGCAEAAGGGGGSGDPQPSSAAAAQADVRLAADGQTVAGRQVRGRGRLGLELFLLRAGAGPKDGEEDGQEEEAVERAQQDHQEHHLEEGDEYVGGSNHEPDHAEDGGYGALHNGKAEAVEAVLDLL